MCLNPNILCLGKFPSNYSPFSLQIVCVTSFCHLLKQKNRTLFGIIKLCFFRKLSIYSKLSTYNTPISGCSSLHFLCINSLVFSLNMFQLLEYSNEPCYCSVLWVFVKQLMKHECLSLHRPGINVPVNGELGIGFTGTMVSLGQLVQVS